jgi:hypothetical protein
LLPHLRKFSNFISPRLGLGAAELWRLIGTMVRNLSLHWTVLLSAVVGVFAFALLILQQPLLAAGVSALAGLILIGRGWWRERQAKTNPDNIEARTLLQAPHSVLFLGFGLWGLASSLAFIQSTCAERRWVGFSIAVGVLFISTILVTISGLMAEWRWETPRHNFYPTRYWLGFGLAIALPIATWWILRAYNASTPGLCSDDLSFKAWPLVWETGLPLVAMAVILSIVIASFTHQMSREEREWATRLVSTTLATAVAWMGIVGLALLSVWLAEYTKQHFSWEMGAGATATAGLWAAISTLAAYLGKTESAQTLRPYWKRLVVVGGPILFVVGLLVFSSFAAALFLLHIATDAVWTGPTVGYLFLGALGLLIIAGIVLDPNEFSLHGFYRDRLVRCYLGASNGGAPAPDAVWNIYTDDIPLVSLQEAVREGAPFQILNTAVNLFGSKCLDVRQRNCDSFALTPISCGSWATNYTRIPPRLYLGTALAVSGAALGSGMGLATRGAALAAVMTFFNLRLGYWFGNPRFGEVHKRKVPWFAPGYLFAEAFSATSEERKFVNLSDGGHFDNLGLYELIRRGCRFILVVDAECDDGYQFAALSEVIRLARIDFGVEINLNVQTIAPTQEGDRFAQAHAAWGTINYRNRKDKAISPYGESDWGHILYIKASLLGSGTSGHIPSDVLGYALQNTSFPHESTVDQFFSEAQFESYRKLGECIADHVFHEVPPDASSFEAIIRTLKPQTSSTEVAV